MTTEWHRPSGTATAAGQTAKRRENKDTGRAAPVPARAGLLPGSRFGKAQRKGKLGAAKERSPLQSTLRKDTLPPVFFAYRFLQYGASSRFCGHALRKHFRSRSTEPEKQSGKKYYVEIPESKGGEEVLEEYVDKEIIIGIRPENIHDEEMFISAAKTGIVDAEVEITELMGAETYLYLSVEGISLTARVSPRSTARPQDTIKVALDPNKIHIFDKETEKTIIN